MKNLPRASCFVPRGACNDRGTRDEGRGALAALFALLLWPALTLADAPQIASWPVPWEGTRPRDAYVAPDGAVWFCGQAGHYLARFDPATEEFRRIDLEDRPGPHNLIIDRAGTVWFAGNLRAYIGALDPASGSIARHAMPEPKAIDLHTLVFDQAGDIWFTVQNGNFVGKLDTGSREIRLLPVPTPGARPYGVIVDAGNRPWFALFGTGKLATVDPSSMQLSEIALPRADARPRRLAATSDGTIWYVDYAWGILGRYAPGTRAFKEWPLPGGAKSQPYAMASDDRDRIWLVETGSSPSRLVAFDPGIEKFTSAVPIPGGDAARHMVYHAPTRTLWFGVDADRIVRARVP
ncbi:MAG: lyase [Gammaproteobacteria bacterium]|nr:lyase [Gammaproteobacteria bacterium]